MSEKELLNAIEMVNYGFFALYYPEYPFKTDYFEICSLYLDPVSPLYLHSVEYIKEELDTSSSNSNSSDEEKRRKIEIDLMSIKRVSFLNEYAPKIDNREVNMITFSMNDHSWISYGFLNLKSYKKFRIFLERLMEVKRSEVSRFFGSGIKSSRSLKVITDSCFSAEYPFEVMETAYELFKKKNPLSPKKRKKSKKDSRRISFKTLKETVIDFTKKIELQKLFSSHCQNYMPGKDLEKVMKFEEFKIFLNLTQGDNFSDDLIKKIIWNLKVDGDIYGLLLGYLDGKSPTEIKKIVKKKIQGSRRDTILRLIGKNIIKRSATINFRNRKKNLKREDEVKLKTKNLANKKESLLRLNSVTEIQRGSNLKLSFIDFCNYIFSENNDILNPFKMKIHEKMNFPLTEYYMNTSHNTYLTGYQIYGNACLEGYRKAIELGCRSFEIDVWDGKNNEPVVTHGNTLTSKIQFKDVMHFLATYTFEISSYPIVISLENHCSEKQQEVMQHCIIDAFGNRIHLPCDDDLVSRYVKMEDLRNKVIIKGKVNIGHFSCENEEVKSPKKKKIINPILESIISLSTTKEFRMDNHPLKILSLSEKKFSELVNSKKINESGSKKMASLHRNYETLRLYTKNRFMRVYPSGLRINSSNLNPVKAWRGGVQMPALNFQSKDEYMALNYAMFRQNGGVGFVKKRFKKIQYLDNRRYRVKLEIISGQDLLLKQHFGDYFFKIWTEGIKEDNEANPIYKVIAHNGSCHYHPVFHNPDTENKKKSPKYSVIESTQLKNQDEFFSTDNNIEFIITDPNLTFVCFKLKYISKKAKSHLPRVSLPLNSLREGYRVVQLHHKNLALLPHCYLLIKYKISRVRIVKKYKP